MDHIKKRLLSTSHSKQCINSFSSGVDYLDSKGILSLQESSNVNVCTEGWFFRGGGVTESRER